MLVALALKQQLNKRTDDNTETGKIYYNIGFQWYFQCDRIIGFYAYFQIPFFFRVRFSVVSGSFSDKFEWTK